MNTEVVSKRIQHPFDRENFFPSEATAGTRSAADGPKNQGRAHINGHARRELRPPKHRKWGVRWSNAPSLASLYRFVI